MDNDFEIIGIDHGWSMVKTSSQVFVTGVKEITTEPGMFDDVLELDGKYYKIGGVRLEVRDVKIENDNFYILTLAGIARELRKRGKKLVYLLQPVYHLRDSVLRSLDFWNILQNEKK